MSIKADALPDFRFHPSIPSCTIFSRARLFPFSQLLRSAAGINNALISAV
ncbi:hypothetical protein FHS25_006709 [Rhizobium laguerreae]|uniref:Uncharacterized protein n=1 Tax=Rhizobium laguerreae TaxID=1076926 RepID=A0ABR6GIQ6_9HYPH|nr:hypothetical protein [Rhizobium laguerreae]MBB3166193.1 hypothetical protein [Rhizobium laguerreae]